MVQSPVIHHTHVFIPQFLTACAGVLRRKLTRYLSTPLDFTGGKVPPIALSCNKMAEKRRSGQITAIAILYPGKELSPDEVVQTFFIGNPVVRTHTGNGVAQSASSELMKIVKKESIATQLVCIGTDDQYFHLGFPMHLREILDLKKAFFYWDPAHRLVLAENDLKTAKIGNIGKDQFPSQGG